MSLQHLHEGDLLEKDPSLLSDRAVDIIFISDFLNQNNKSIFNKDLKNFTDSLKMFANQYRIETKVSTLSFGYVQKFKEFPDRVSFGNYFVDEQLM